MTLYNPATINNKRGRPTKTLTVQVDEKPQLPVYLTEGDKDRSKFIKTCLSTIRKSFEYKDYISFLKENMDMRRCVVLNKLHSDFRHKYTINIHHEPFSHAAIIDTVIRRRESFGERITPLVVSDEVMELHYDGKVGLIPLTETMHQLVEANKIFIPLQYIYQDYHKFYDEYHPYMSEPLIKLIMFKAGKSLECDTIQSDIAPQFTYLEIDGFEFPEVPDDWKSEFRGITIED